VDLNADSLLQQEIESFLALTFHQKSCEIPQGGETTVIIWAALIWRRKERKHFLGRAVNNNIITRFSAF
jgi:hypothetical protein